MTARRSLTLGPFVCCVCSQLYTKTYTLFDSLQQIAEQELIRREQAGGSSTE